MRKTNKKVFKRKFILLFECYQLHRTKFPSKEFIRFSDLYINKLTWKGKISLCTKSQWCKKCLLLCCLNISYSSYLRSTLSLFFFYLLYFFLFLSSTSFLSFLPLFHSFFFFLHARINFHFSLGNNQSLISIFTDTNSILPLFSLALLFQFYLI